jgi:hypothetical protein
MVQDCDRQVCWKSDHSKDQNRNGRITQRLVLRRLIVSTELAQDYVQRWAVLLVVLSFWVLLS